MCLLAVPAGPSCLPPITLASGCCLLLPNIGSVSFHPAHCRPCPDISFPIPQLCLMLQSCYWKSFCWWVCMTCGFHQPESFLVGQQVKECWTHMWEDHNTRAATVLPPPYLARWHKLLTAPLATWLSQLSVLAKVVTLQCFLKIGQGNLLAIVGNQQQKEISFMPYGACDKNSDKIHQKECCSQWTLMYPKLILLERRHFWSCWVDSILLHWAFCWNIAVLHGWAAFWAKGT